MGELKDWARTLNLAKVGAEAEREKIQRLSVLATKHCPIEHHDWQELKQLLTEMNQDVPPQAGE